MNSIKAIKAPSRYCKEPHLQIEIDGKLLDRYLEEQTGEEYGGLVPTLLPWISDEKESEYCYEKILPENQESIAPILMCPDDVDLWCTLIVAKIKVSAGKVYWRKLGLENSAADTLEELCSEVKWFEIKPFEFEIEDYKKFIKKFKEEA